MNSTVTYNAAHNTIPIIGLGNKYRTSIEPSGNFPCFELSGVAYADFSNLKFANNNTTYTSPFIRMKDACVWNTLSKLYFINNVADTYKGIAIELKPETTGSIYYNDFIQLYTRWLDTDYNIDSTTPTDTAPWITSNCWTNCRGFHSKFHVKVRQKPGATLSTMGSFAWNVWLNDHFQSLVGVTDTVYDFDGNGFIQVALVGGTMQWDLESGHYAVKVPQTGWLWLDGTKDIVSRIGGSGVNSPTMKISIGSDAIHKNQGTGTVTGDGIQTDFVVTHNHDWYYDNEPPTFWRVWVKSQDAIDAGVPQVIPSTVTPKTMTVRFQRPPKAPNPSSGSNNIIIAWEVYQI